MREDCSHQLSRVPLVVHNEDADAVERRKSTGLPCSGRYPGGLRLASRTFVRDRESHREGRPLAEPGALGVDGPAVEFHEMSHDAEPDPQSNFRLPAAVPKRGRCEDLRELVGFDPFARVAHAHLDGGSSTREADHDLPAARRELDRVGREVPEDLLQPDRVASDRPGRLVERALQPDPLGLRRTPRGGQRRLDRRGHHHGPSIEAQGPGDDA